MSNVVVHANRNVILRLNAPQVHAANTARRGRVTAPEVPVHVGKPLNVATYLDLAPAVAEDVLKRSPDVVRYLRAGFITIASDEPAAPTAPPEAWWPPEPVQSLILDPEAEQRAFEYAHNLPARPPAMPADPKALSDAIEMPPTATLTPTIKVEETEIAPSVRWSKERLVEYAQARGVPDADTLTKNALIRALRRR